MQTVLRALRLLHELRRLLLTPMSELADLLERFRRGAELLAVVTTGVAGPELDFKLEGHGLSIRQIVCHLADAEAVSVMRLRHVIAEDNPLLPNFDGDAWAAKLDYAKRKLSQPLETCRRLRMENFELLKDLPPETFSRTGVHSKDGTVTLRQLVESGAAHLEDHVREIQAIRAAYREHRLRQTAQAAKPAPHTAS
jgi:uncharacterized protein Usg